MKATERQFYLAVILILTAVIFTQRACSSKCSRQHCDELKDFKPIEVTAIDTVEKIVKDSTHWHKPKSIEMQSEPPELAWLDFTDTTLQRIRESQKRDSLAVEDWYKWRMYLDTNHFADGDVIVEAMVTKNRLGSLRVLPSFNQKTITIEKTVTNYVPSKPRGQLYFGLLAEGEEKNFLTAFGASALWKTKRDKIWTFSTLYDRRIQLPIFQVGTYFKLSFKNKTP